MWDSYDHTIKVILAAVCFHNTSTLVPYRPRSNSNTVFRRYQGKTDSRCTDRVEELSRQLLEFLSLSLSLTQSLSLSFLASDSRHPAMTWGVSEAARAAALNRQKYLLWQTDTPSPTTTCMQLSQSLALTYILLFRFLNTPNSVSYFSSAAIISHLRSHSYV